MSCTNYLVGLTTCCTTSEIAVFASVPIFYGTISCYRRFFFWVVGGAPAINLCLLNANIFAAPSAIFLADFPHVQISSLSLLFFFKDFTKFCFKLEFLRQNKLAVKVKKKSPNLKGHMLPDD